MSIFNPKSNSKSELVSRLLTLMESDGLTWQETLDKYCNREEKRYIKKLFKGQNK